MLEVQEEDAKVRRCRKGFGRQVQGSEGRARMWLRGARRGIAFASREAFILMEREGGTDQMNTV
jgi:hypothetical protein